MFWIAWRMLIGNPGKYLGIVLGVAVSAFLIAQQASIFCGLMNMTASQIRDVKGVDLWVCDESIQFVSESLPMTDTALNRVRGVSGIEWAVKFYRGIAKARLPSGKFQQVILLGLDESSFVGAPQTILRGSLADLNKTDAIIMDDAGYKQLWPNDPDYQLGRTIEMNDRRGVLVGICTASRTFETFPVIYTRFNNAVQYSPTERRTLSYILAKADPDVDIAALCQKINQQTGLAAYTHAQFIDKTIWYFMKNTGIPINFGFVVVLAFIVGAAIAGQTFYLFTVDNIKQFGTLKAMGMTNLRIFFMVMFQSLQVGLIGLGLGLGGAALFGHMTRGNTKLAFLMIWPIPIITLAAVLLIIIIASIFSLWRALTVEPAIVFKG
ncbi:MAG: ABC transporter permease [Pirellulales bacterium]|nr:ABC transporter permease [Pirellulales bacterium]